MRSMTGFGEGRADVDGVRVDVLVRAVNHRQLDVRIAGLDAWPDIESEWGATIRDRLARGRVEVRATIDVDAGEAADSGPAYMLHRRLQALADRFGWPAPTLADFIAAGGMRLDPAADLSSERLRPVAARALGAALDAFVAFRRREGDALGAFVTEHLERLSAVVDTVEQGVPAAVERHRERLESRLAELKVSELDPQRLAQEVAILADRADITEELVRAREHVAALSSLVAPREEPVGKKVDFILQELVRETNTMASKVADPASKSAVIDAKALVEQLREQCSNVE